jgi:SnoaL-like domain
MNDVIDRYFDCWNMTDPGKRRKLIGEVWADEAEYIDPLAQVRGHEAIDANIAAVQAQFPGWVFALAGAVDAHHQQARFSWNFGPEGAEPQVVGSDVAVIAEDGRISTVLGFLDKAPG